MRSCLKCGDNFPVMATIDGKKKNLSSRKYCLNCSPFAKHNTSKLHEKLLEGCPICGSLTNKSRKGRKICWGCENKRAEEFAADKLYTLTGENCWICNYGNGKETRSILDFHHIENKNFSLTKRIVGRTSWNHVLQEARKCALLCCRCHREFHNGLIEESKIKQVWIDKWLEIDRQ